MSLAFTKRLALCLAILSLAAAHVIAADGPVIHRVSPSTIADTGGTIQILGQNFYRDSVVLIDNVQVGVTFRSSGRLEVYPPAHLPGSVDVLVINPDTQQIISKGALTYLPRVQFAIPPPPLPITGSEATASVVLNLTLSAAYTADVTVVFKPNASGFAKEPDDFAGSGIATIPAGQTTGSFTVTIVDDAVAEPNESFTIVLSSPTNAVLGTPISHMYTIVDNDPNVVSISAPSTPTLTEGVAGASSKGFTISRIGDVSAAVTVNLTVGGTATSGSDYFALAGTAVIGAGSSSTTVFISLLNDLVVEPDETLTVALTAGTGYTVNPLSSLNSISQTIRDNDTPPANDNFAAAQLFSGLPVLPTVGTTIGATTQPGETVTSNGSVWYNFTPTVSGGIYVTLSEADFTARRKVYTGAAVNALTEVFETGFFNSKGFVFAYQVTAGVTYRISVDSGNFPTIAQGNFKIALRDVNDSPAGGGATGVPGTLPLVSVLPTTDRAFEQGSIPGVFTIYRSGATTAPLTVWFSLDDSNATPDDASISTGPEDFTFSGATFDANTGLWFVTIPIGAASTTVTITPIDDKEEEGDYDNPFEEAGLALVLDPVGANPTYDLSVLENNNFAVINIFDNDLPPDLSYSPRSTNGMLNAPFSYQLIVLGSNTECTATDLPPGLTISATGLISGIPTQEGLFKTVITARSNSTPTVQNTATATVDILIVPQLFITTYAGNGAAAPIGTFAGDDEAGPDASLSVPTGVAIDGFNNVYFSDMGNHRVRKIAGGTGIVTTVAGNGVRGFNGDGVTATSTSLDYPGGLAVDSAGNLYICDVNNHRVRKVDTKGIITTVAGSGSTYTNEGSFTGDGEPGTSAKLNFPCGVAVNAAGDVYIADTGNNRVRKVNATTGIITTVAGNSNRGFSFDDPFFSTGSASPFDGPALNVSLNSPVALAIDASGNVYIAEQKGHKIRKLVVSTNVIATVAGHDADDEGNGIEYSKPVAGFFGDGSLAVIAALNQPCGVAVDGGGNVYITEIANNRIRKVDAATGLISSISGSGPIVTSETNAAAYDEFANGSPLNETPSFNLPGLPLPALTGVSGFSGDGGRSFGAGLSVPTGITIDPAGRIYFSDSANLRVRQIAPAGAAPTIAGFTATPNPALINATIEFVASASDADTPSLLYKWDFGDGSAATGESVTKKYTAIGAFTVTLVVTDGATNVASTQVVTIVEPASGGTANLSDGTTVENPVDDISITVIRSLGGVIELEINVGEIANRADDYVIETSFDGVSGLVGRGTGKRVVQKFIEPGIYVATSKVKDAVTNAARGTGRKTLTISGRELGQGALSPTNAKIVGPSLKGKFLFNASDKSDLVAFGGAVTLPKGFDIGKSSQSLAVSVGNVIDTVEFDTKGKPKFPSKLGNITKFKISYPKLSSGTVTQDDKQVAKITMTIAKPDLDEKGFSSDGITTRRGVNDSGDTLSRRIQTAFVLNGVAYESIVPVDFKISAKGDSGGITGRK